MEGLKEDNEWEEDIKGGVKKEALSKAKKWIEKIPYVGDVVEGVDEVVELIHPNTQTPSSLISYCIPLSFNS